MMFMKNKWKHFEIQHKLFLFKHMNVNVFLVILNTVFFNYLCILENFLNLELFCKTWKYQGILFVETGGHPNTAILKSTLEIQHLYCYLRIHTGIQGNSKSPLVSKYPHWNPRIHTGNPGFILVSQDLHWNPTIYTRILGSLLDF